MKPAIVLFFLLSFAIVPLTSRAQNYIFEFNPKYFHFPSTHGYGLSIDGDFFLSKSFSIGFSLYGDLYQDNMYGLNLGLSSDRQKKFGYYGNVKILYSQDGEGFLVGAGMVYRLGRKVNFNILELNYVVGDSMYSKNSDGYESGHRGIVIESGFVFKMFRKK